MKIGLFIPCYVDALYPEVGVASYKLLKALGVDVDYPLNQTCCGQPQALVMGAQAARAVTVMIR